MKATKLINIIQLSSFMLDVLKFNYNVSSFQYVEPLFHKRIIWLKLFYVWLWTRRS